MLMQARLIKAYLKFIISISGVKTLVKGSLFAVQIPLDFPLLRPCHCALNHLEPYLAVRRVMHSHSISFDSICRYGGLQTKRLRIAIAFISAWDISHGAAKVSVNSSCSTGNTKFRCVGV